MPGETGDCGQGSPDTAGGPLLERAGRALAAERQRAVDERDAFDEFRRQVRDVRPASAAVKRGPDGGPGGVQAVGTTDRTAGNGLSAVRTAYRETVMDVSHFAAEYDESYAESVAAELGPDLAAALVARERFDPVCKRTLLDRVDERHSRRVTLVEALDAERESLETVGERVASIEDALGAVAVDGTPVVETVEAGSGDAASALHTDASFDALADVHAALRECRDRCDAVATDRQTTVQAQAARLSLPVGSADVPSYCYQSLPVTYPALSTVTDLGERVTTCLRAVERDIADL